MESEFASLVDLAESHGIAHSALLNKVHTAVLEAYRELYPKAPIGVEVIVDEATGNVRLMAGDEDMTPPKFTELAAKAARQAVIKMISGTPDVDQSVPQATKINGGKLFTVLVNIFYWGYNLYFTLISFSVGLFYLFTKPPAIQILLTLVLMLLPIGSIAIALLLRWYNRPGALARWFFLFELPLAVFCLITQSIIPETRGFGIMVVLASLGLPITLFLAETKRGVSMTVLKLVLVIEQFVVMIFGYLLMLFSFWIPVILGLTANSLFHNLFNDYIYYGSGSSYYAGSIISNLSGLTIDGIVMIIEILALSLPYILIWVLIKELAQTRNKLAVNMSQEKLNIFQGILAAVIISISILAAYQRPNPKLIQTLGNLSKATTFEQKEAIAKELVPKEAEVKEALTNMEGVSNRYIFSKDETGLASGYQEAFGLNETVSSVIQKTFLAAAYPFVYQGESNDNTALQYNFKYIFGYYPYQTARITQPIASKNVLMTYRKYSAKPTADGLAAAVTVEEEYSNNTYTQQEVVYEFNLPQGSVITDLKLGPDLEFPGVIAPRGAAQQTYNLQMQQRRDPALLEMTGTRSYRLRIFPIPAKNDNTTLKGKLQKVQYTYAVPADTKGYPLPEYTKQTNVFSNNTSSFLMDNNGTITYSNKELTHFASLTGTAEKICSSNQISKQDAGGMQVKIEPTGCSNQMNMTKIVQGQKFAIFYNTSQTNRYSADKFKADLEGIPSFLDNNAVYLYKYNELLSQPVRLTSANVKNLWVGAFGENSNTDNLTKINEKYQGVILVGSELTDNSRLPFAAPTKIYIVDYNQNYAYPMKITSKIIQAGGDTVASVNEAIKQYSSKYNSISTPYEEAIGENWKVFLAPESDLNKLLISNTDVWSAMANAAIYKHYLTDTLYDVTANITRMDQLNTFAKKAGIVTPYSSYIALVNEQQKQTLENLSQNYNRYAETPTPAPRTAPRIIMNPSLMAPTTPNNGQTGLFFGAINSPGLKSVSPVDISLAPLAASSIGASQIDVFLWLNGLLLIAGMGVYLIYKSRRRRA